MRRAASAVLCLVFAFAGYAAADVPVMSFDAGPAGRLDLAPDGIAAADLSDGDTSAILTFRLAPDPAAALGDLTGRAIGRSVAILLCGTEIVAPVIHARIDGGTGRLTLPDAATATAYVAALRGDAPCPAD